MGLTLDEILNHMKLVWDMLVVFSSRYANDVALTVAMGRIKRG